MAVLKAEAYGHGVVTAAGALGSADGFAVLELDTAVVLRSGGHRQRLLLLEGPFHHSDLVLAARHRVDLVLHHDEQIDMLLRPPQLARRVDVLLKINTGMNRLGFPPSRLRYALNALRQSEFVGSIVLMTHFARADELDGIREPLAIFDHITHHLGLPASLAASAAVICHPESHRDWVRPGIMLFGASPIGDMDASSLGLSPAMTLASQIIAVQALQAGDSIGYGSTFQATTSMTVGIVACGYGDGYPRSAPTGTPVLVAGQRSRLLGQVSMDMLCVDLTSLHHVGLGSEVVLWGPGLPIEKIARMSGTIANDLLCSVSSRVTRVVDAVDTIDSVVSAGSFATHK